MGRIMLATSNSTDEEYGGIIEKKYSTTEQVVGTWIDGKPLYEKVVSCGALPNTTSKTIAHDISNVEKIVSLDGIALRTTVGTSLSEFALPYMFSFQNTINYVSISANATQIIITATFDATQYNESYATLRYTKTTS